jgi:anaphase-promoting complex subunit 6
LERRGILSNKTINVIKSVVHPFPTNWDDSTVKQLSTHQNKFVDDSLRGVYLAAQCLFLIGQYEDCFNLLRPLVLIDDDESMTDLTTSNHHAPFIASKSGGICQMSSLYCLVGKCFFAMDNRAKALNALLMSLKVDMACLESLEFIVEHGLLNEKARVEYYDRAFDSYETVTNDWLKVYYRKILSIPCDRGSISVERSACMSRTICSEVKLFETDDGPALLRKADFFFRRRFFSDAYNCSKRSYFLDPHDNHCLSVYVASLVQLKHLTELFYLAHELVSSFPKSSTSWYTVGCYYWCLAQMDIAQLYFLKANQIDKRNVKSWIMLGHVLSHQEENEQAISAYRTAIRLLPDNFLPVLFIARELLRANHDILALQILVVTSKFCCHDPTILNEIGVANFKLRNYSDALKSSADAIGLNDLLITHSCTDLFFNVHNKSHEIEVVFLCVFLSLFLLQLQI